MSSITCPHDKLFKSAMADIRVARDFLAHHLPKAVLAKTDFDSLQFCSNSYVDAALKLSLSDVLYKVNIAGQIAYIYLLVEHQSSIDELMPFRLWQYIIAIWADHLKKTKQKALPLVVPLVFYHGSKPYDGPRDIRELIQAPLDLTELLFKPFHLVDTANLPDEILREQQWAGIMTFTMKHIYSRNIMTWVQSFVEMLQKLEQAGASDYGVLMLNYLLNVGEVKQPEAFVDVIRAGLSSETGDKIVTTVAEYLRQQGREQGIQQGVQVGESSMLLRLLEGKFGVISPMYRERIQKADSAQLLCWGEKIFEVASIEQLFIN